MKLSLKKRFGFVQVRGGSFYRVTRTHQVGTNTRSYAEEENPQGDRKTAFAQPGDLAIEVVNKKLEKRVGYAYLSGDAIRLIGYEAEPAWFAPATSMLIDIPGVPQSQAETEALVKQFIEAKFQHDAGVFEYRAPKGSDPAIAAKGLAQCYSYESRDIEPRGHVFGLVHAGKSGISVHFQPRGQTTEFAASRFQIMMAVRAVRERS